MSAAGGQCVGCKEIVSGNLILLLRLHLRTDVSPQRLLGVENTFRNAFDTADALNTADFSANYSTWDDEPAPC